MTPDQIEQIEANLRGLNARLPGAPLDGILITRLLVFLGHHVGMMLDQHIRPYGLSEGEFRVLTMLYSQPDGTANPSELCSRTAQSPANMSRISDALVARALITRDLSAHDRRRMVLRVTQKGEELARRLLPTLWLPLRELIDVLTEAEQRQIIALLKSLALKVDAVRPPFLPEDPA